MNFIKKLKCKLNGCDLLVQIFVDTEGQQKLCFSSCFRCKKMPSINEFKVFECDYCKLKFIKSWTEENENAQREFEKHHIYSISKGSIGVLCSKCYKMTLTKFLVK